MSDTNERQVEKLLKVAGAKRRQQAGSPQVHPAMREVLRTEVHRQYTPTRAESESGFRWLTGWLPKLAVFLVLTVTACWVWFHQWEQAPGPMALQRSNALVAPTSQPAPQVSSITRAPVEADVPSAELPARQAASARRESADETGAESAVGTEYFKADREAIYMGTATLEPQPSESADRKREIAVAALMSAPPPAKGNEARDKSDVAVMPSPRTVLQSFTVFQEGNRLRIVDDDGSTYEGQVVVVARPASGSVAGLSDGSSMAGGAPAVADRLAGGESSNLAVLNYNITAAGTNRSLGQALRFSGTLALTGQQVQLGRNVFSNTLARVTGETADAPFPKDAGVVAGRVQGVAVLENGQDVRVDAVPVGP